MRLLQIHRKIKQPPHDVSVDALLVGAVYELVQLLRPSNGLRNGIRAVGARRVELDEDLRKKKQRFRTWVFASYSRLNAPNPCRRRCIPLRACRPCDAALAPDASGERCSVCGGAGAGEMNREAAATAAWRRRRVASLLEAGWADEWLRAAGPSVLRAAGHSVLREAGHSVLRGGAESAGLPPLRAESEGALLGARGVCGVSRRGGQLVLQGLRWWGSSGELWLPRGGDSPIRGRVL